MKKEIIKYEIELKLLEIKENQIRSESMLKQYGECSTTMSNRNHRLIDEVKTLIEQLKES